MKLIESIDFEGFSNYLSKFSNTICGRFPICMLLKICDENFKIEFIKYEQSTILEEETEDSSVSYACGVGVVTK